MAGYFILIPLLFLMLLNIPLKFIGSRLSFWGVIIICMVQITAVLVPSLELLTGNSVGLVSYFNFGLYIDGLSRLMLLVIGLITLVSVMTCCGLIKEEAKRFNFMNVILVTLIGMNGIVMVNDLFTMYVYIEAVGVSTFILIAFNKDRDALESGFKYIVFSSIATIIMLSSLALLLLYSGNTSFASVAAAVKGSGSSHLVIFAISMYLVGLLIKSGLMPFHGWVPDSYTYAPATTSIMLAGIITKAAGVYPLMRIVSTVFGYSASLNGVLLFVGAFTVVIAAFAAITQSDMKRMLSYSSISQVGYIILSLGSGTVLGFAGAVFHLFNHAIFKSILFINSASVESSTGNRDIDKMSGLAQKMPITGVTSALAAMSVSGIPPLSGFWSKLIIIIALWTSKNYSFAVIAALASVITLGYMLTLQRKAFFGKPEGSMKDASEANVQLLLPAIILAAVLIGVSVFSPYLIGSYIVPIGGLK